MGYASWRSFVGHILVLPLAMLGILQPLGARAQAISFSAEKGGGTIEFSKIRPSITFLGAELAAGRTTKTATQTVTFETKARGNRPKFLQVYTDTPLDSGVGALSLRIRDFRVLKRNDQGGRGGRQPEVTLLVEEGARLDLSTPKSIVRMVQTDVRAELRVEYVVQLKNRFVRPTTADVRLTYRFTRQKR